MYNKIILIGRLTRDPELRYTTSGHPVANFTLAVDRPFKTAQGERQADFIDVAAWRKLAEVVAQYVSKGQMLTVEGRLEIRSYDGNDGTRRKAATVVADGIRLFPKSMNGQGASKAADDGRAPETETASETAQDEPEPEDVPF